MTAPHTEKKCEEKHSHREKRHSHTFPPQKKSTTKTKTQEMVNDLKSLQRLLREALYIYVLLDVLFFSLLISFGKGTSVSYHADKHRA